MHERMNDKKEQQQLQISHHFCLSSTPKGNDSKTFDFQDNTRKDKFNTIQGKTAEQYKIR